VQDENKWIRRFGVVVLRAFEKVDLPEGVLEVLAQVMQDRDRDVKKGAAWMLRDLSKRHGTQVFEFLLGWAESDPTLDTAWIIKNGPKRLPEDQQRQLLLAMG